MQILHQLYDAWKINPPCQTLHFCIEECPYSVECNPDEDSIMEELEEEEDMWNENFEKLN